MAKQTKIWTMTAAFVSRRQGKPEPDRRAEDRRERDEILEQVEEVADKESHPDAADERHPDRDAADVDEVAVRLRLDERLIEVADEEGRGRHARSRQGRHVGGQDPGHHQPDGPGKKKVHGHVAPDEVGIMELSRIKGDGQEPRQGPEDHDEALEEHARRSCRRGPPFRSWPTRPSACPWRRR